MINTFLYKKLRERSPEQLYKPPAGSLAVNYDAPTDTEKQQVSTLLLSNTDFQAMPAAHQEGFHRFLFELERKLPVINTEGRPVKGNIRLTVCLEMARILYLRRKGIPRQLRSVIIEASHVFLTRHADSTGLATSAGPKTYLPPLEAVQQNLAQVLLVIPGKDQEDMDKQHLLERQLKKIKKLAGKEPLSDFYEKQLHNELLEMKKTYSYLFERLIHHAQNADGPEWEQVCVQAGNYKENVFDALDRMAGSLSAQHSGMHLYLSWPYYLANIYDQKGRNVILHETAHAIDFENDGFNGIPAPAVLHEIDERDWHTRWNRQFDQAKAGRMDFLDDYALKNKLEFLAVSTECFFHKSDLLKEKAPELYELLEKTYGYVPTPAPSSSWKKMLKIPEMFKQLRKDSDDILNR